MSGNRKNLRRSQSWLLNALTCCVRSDETLSEDRPTPSYITEQLGKLEQELRELRNALERPSITRSQLTAESAARILLSEQNAELRSAALTIFNVVNGDEHVAASDRELSIPQLYVVEQSTRSSIALPREPTLT